MYFSLLGHFPTVFLFLSKTMTTTIDQYEGIKSTKLREVFAQANKVCEDVLTEKYLKGDEKGAFDLFQRVSTGLVANYKDDALAKTWKKNYMSQFLKGYGVGAGRIMSATGTGIDATSINCFVLAVGDSIDGYDEDGNPGIYMTLTHAAVTLRRGGGCGYNFSLIRPRGAFVKGTNSYASGPCSYIDVYDKSCATVESAGGRRGAQMGILDINHPDIEEFITAKRTPGRWNYFNVSVFVTDAFMKAREEDADWVLYHKKPPALGERIEHIVEGHKLGYVYKVVKARALWKMIMESNYKFAEPGVLFEDTINRDNNLRYIERLKATNPCVTGDTVVLTENGPEFVRNLVNKEVKVFLNGKLYDSSGFYSTGIKAVYEVKTEPGYSLKLTKNHPVMTHDGKKFVMKPVEELQKGALLLMNNHSEANWTSKEAVADEFMFGLDSGLEYRELSFEEKIKLFQRSSDYLKGYLQKLEYSKGSIFRCKIPDNSIVTFVFDTEQEAKQTQILYSFVGVKSFITELVDNETGVKTYELKVNYIKMLVDYVHLLELTYVGEEEVYDIAVRDDVHAFSANGFYISNCAEQPLPANGCCDLGPLDISAFVLNSFTSQATFDAVTFTKAIHTHVRMLDDVLDTTFWPLPAQKAESDSKRRIGVGITGLGTALMYLGIRYGSEESIIFTETLLTQMKEECYIASSNLAVERGSFPLLDIEKYLEEGTAASRLSESTKALIRKQGIRNSHLMSIAPTGTISIAFFDNVSSGIEPAFSLYYTRKVRDRINPSISHLYPVIDKGLKSYLLHLSNNGEEEKATAILEKLTKGEKPELPEYFITALEMSVDEHISVLKVAAPLIDTAISKTVNVPADYPYEDFEQIYLKAYESGLKGISTYRPNDILGSVLQEVKKEEAPVKKESTLVKDVEEFLYGTIEKLPEKRLKAIRGKISYMSAEGPEQIYVVVSYLSQGFLVEEGSSSIMSIHRPIEVFITTHDQGASPEWLNAQSISMSLLARSGLKMFYKNLENMRSVRSPRGAIRYDFGFKEDGTKYPLWHESSVAVVAYEVLKIMHDLNLVSIQDHRLLSAKEIIALSTKVDAETYVPDATSEVEITKLPNEIIHGKQCRECGAHAVIKADGCERCTNCGAIGSCG